ncbi:hypothetical protein PF010_g1575 [Phytophthora fragariae]|uniref:Dynein heavy chain linker domain-containing protein n=1 Tax=Phytophthora fragariae TaxID=53985 RepID=A0A6G0PVT1_9STRA|nr:hypothetical protein PF010_g1575 [Phytophthora fragariae]KAE9256049.1 hypothetical protein PF004_g276 [Phytophthora fragariae]
MLSALTAEQRDATNSAPLVDRLHLNWQSIPTRKQAKLYSPSTTQLPHGRNNGTSGLLKVSARLSAQTPRAIGGGALSAPKLSKTCLANVAAFEQKYAAEDPLMRYVVHVIRTGSPVRRSEIPRGKHIQRKVRPEEDVLYLVHCETPPCGFRNVYWLTFADEGTALHGLEYFTLSSHGLTRFKDGRGVEFSDLAGWVDEKRAFDHMTTMKGLERIQQMIFFFSWKRQAVQRRLHRVQERLACSLFTCHPVAASLMMDVRDVCAEIEREAEHKYTQEDTSYTLERLAHLHRERVRAAKVAITKKIYSLCVTIDSATQSISRYKDGEGCSYAMTEHEAFSKSLRLSSLRERMFTFLRLVDCHVAEAIYQHVTIVVRDLRARICGVLSISRAGAGLSTGNGERSVHLCRSEATEEAPGSTTTPSQICQRVNYSVQPQESDAPVVAIPGLYISSVDDVNFDGDVNSATMQLVPTKVEVLELVHSILLKYCVAMDGLPRVLTNAHFKHVLTPFVPSVRRDFAESLLKPSHLVLESYELELREMRSALDMHFRRIGILQQEHLRCVRAIKVAERESPVETTKGGYAAELDEDGARLPQLPDLTSSAAAYELAQKTWSRFVQYSSSAAPMLQVGYLLLDQSVFVEKLRSHVSKRVAEMDDALPSIYQQFLTSLLEDVDGCIEKVTKIPTNLAEANVWLAQVTSMMQTHPFRQRLDTKIANLARLRALIKEHGILSLDQEVQDSIRKLELTWESVIETLLMCLARVEERGSEHRRSVLDVISKVDEYITGQLQLVVKTFEGLPSGCEEHEEANEDEEGEYNSVRKRSPIVLVNTPTKEEMVQQLEDLVAMDLERKNVVQQYEEYDREHRAIMDLPSTQQAVWASSSSDLSSENLSVVSMADKLPSELLLLYIVTSLELRQWYESWKKLRDKWLGSPLSGVHPGTMINRIKQFRRRLGYASSRLSRLSSVLLQVLPLEPSDQHQAVQQYEDEDRKECATFAKKDFELMRVFDASIEDMLNCNRIFQAISSGAFTDARWAAMNQLLDVQSGPNGAGGLTLRRMKDKCDSDQIEAFLEFCDGCIVEAKLHLKLEQTRQRLARIEVRVEETNYSVRCEGIAEALAQLDDIAVELKLCLFGQNPELHLCLELRADMEQKIAVCKHILAYQKHWRLRCEATKLHEVDEFFSKRFSSGGGGGNFAVPRARTAQHKSGLKQEHALWQAFLEASHAWSDRLRRLFFVSPHQPQVEQAKTAQPVLLGKKTTASAGPASVTMAVHRRLSAGTKSMNCTLDDVMESFGGFDFEANLAACERGMELVQTYLDSVREKLPRMYCLDETTMLRLLLRDSDIQQLHQSLAICFPRVHRFAISRAANRVGSSVEIYGKQESLGAPVRASKTDGTIVISGLQGVQDSETCGCFRLPVAKIGRVKFWFTRLEEEMSSMVVADLKRAFEWATHDPDSPQFSSYESLLPQSIVTALALRFTFEMNRALRSHDHERMTDELQRLQLSIDERLGALVASRRTDKTTLRAVRLDSMILLTVMQLTVVRHVAELIDQGQLEDALFFWSMQFQTRAFAEVVSAPATTTQPSPTKHGKLERNELFPVSSDFMKASPSSQSGQSMNVSVCCQVAHLQMPLGQEFVGWGKLAIISPFTQRCAYALFSALRMHHTALVVPYNTHQAGKDPASLLWGVTQLLMRPCIEFSCNPSAGVTTVHHLNSLVNAVSRLNGFLIVRDLLHLSAALIGVVRERMLQHFHQASHIGTLNAHHAQQQAVSNSLVLPRHSGGLSYGASAVFIPLSAPEDLPKSGLVQAIRTQFRAVAVTRPAVQYLVECLLLADGLTVEQIRELNVVEAFEAIEAEEVGTICSLNVESLVPCVVEEAQRLQEHYRVVWDVNPLAASRRAEVREGQCIFRHAFNSSIEAVLSEEQGCEDKKSAEQLNRLLVRVFPLSEGGRLVSKSKGDEEAVAAAVAIYLESAYSLPTGCEQFELTMELWRAMQTFPAALVYGPPGSGKTTCVTALHRALVALELSEQNEEGEEPGRRNSHAAMKQLVVLNPQLLTLDQFYKSISAACGAADNDKNKRKVLDSDSLKWILVDGEVDGSVLDRLLQGDNRSCISTSSLPTSSILYRDQNSCVLSGDGADPRDSPRMLFEVTSLANLSPSALQRCWALHIPARCITVASIIGAWRTRWENQLVFPPDSRGFEAMTAVFKTVHVLVSSICVGFVVEESTHDQGGAAEELVDTGTLRLGCLSLNHLTQTALTFVSVCCFQNKSLLQELPYLRLVELTTFAVLWGFAGHLPDPFKPKLENYVRMKSKEHNDIKHLAELSRGLLDADSFEDVWDELQPRLIAPLAPQPAAAASNRAEVETKMQSAFDPSSGQVLVLVPAVTSMIRVCTVLLHSWHSYVLVGPAASGKTSLLRWLMHQNREAEAAEMKIETSLDERHVHGILDWTGAPAAWFQPLDQRDSAASSRAKMREETELFAGRSRHSFVFLDDLNATGEATDGTAVQFVRTMLDHRIGLSSKHGGFHSVEKQIGAAMRLDEMVTGLSPTLERLLRHFVVLRVPTYPQKELLSIFRVKFQQHFRVRASRMASERRISAKGGMGGPGSSQQLPLEEVVLRASVDFAMEMASFQQLGDTDHPCLCLLNLHHINTLLERSLVSVASISGAAKNSVTNSRAPAAEGTTLVMLGKAHQSWLSELQSVFLSNCPAEAPAQPLKVGGPAEPSSDDTQRKISALLRHLSEKYFSVAIRSSSDTNLPVSVETLHCLVKLAEYHVQAPLLQPRLMQIHGLLNEYITAASGVSRRASEQVRAAAIGGQLASSPVELVSSVLMEIASASSSSDAGKTNRSYSRGQLAALEAKVLLSSSWCLTQASQLIHALSQQQLIVVSPVSVHSRLLSERLLRFTCDLHGYEVQVVDEKPSSDQALDGHHKHILRLAIGAAGVRQERVALWVRQHQLNRGASRSTSLLDFIQELCLGKLPSLTLLPGGEELRDELVLSCIQSRKQLEVVTETELMVEFRHRLQQNLRVCIVEEGRVDQSTSDGAQRPQVSQPSEAFLSWMKSRPSCHWRRLSFTDLELQRLIPEVAKATISSPDLCGVAWEMQTRAKFVLLYQNVHLLMMRGTSTIASPASQLDYFLSFMANITVEFGVKYRAQNQKVARLENAIATVTLARDKVVPTLERLKVKFELDSAQIHAELDVILLQQEMEEQQDSSIDEESQDPPDEKPVVDPEAAEARWVLRSRREELTMMSCETKLRLEEVTRLLAEWHHVADRMNVLFTKWTQGLDQEKCRTEHELMGIAVFVAAQRAYAYSTSLSPRKRSSCLGLLADLIVENVGDDSSSAVEKRLWVDSADDVTEDDTNWLVRLIWTSRFPFLRNAEVYRTVRLADELCDHVPVFVDPTGVVQRFLVHIFSGHTLFPTLPGCGAAGEVESENPSATKESVVISCDDSKLELQLQEAQRLAKPVLLVNFRSSDKELLDLLQPFLAHSRLSHGPPRCSMLHELTLKYYEDQRKQKQRKTSIAGSAMAAMSSLAQTAATLSGGAAMMARRAVRAGKLKSVAIDPLVVAAAVSSTSTTTPVQNDRRDARGKNPTSTSSTTNARCFQIYAVTATPVPLQIQHDLVAQFAHFAIALPDSELESLLQVSRLAKTQPKLLQELRGDQIGVAECWVKVNQNRDQLMQLLETLKPVITEDKSPFASRRSGTEVPVQLQERYSELAMQLSNEYQAELMWRSREKDLQDKYDELAVVANSFTSTAIQLVGVARCMATMSSLKLGIRSSPFYPQSFRYLESAATQQLAAQGDDVIQLSVDSLNAIVGRVSSGFVSTSHRQLLRFLEVLTHQARSFASSKAENIEFAVWKEAVVWLVTGNICKAILITSDSFQQLDESGKKDAGLEIIPRRRNSLKWPGDSGSSLVERLRRRVKLCAYLFNGWKSSRSSTNARGKQPKALRPLLHSSTSMTLQIPGISQGRADSNESDCNESKDMAIDRLQQNLDNLLFSSETFWYEWKTSRVRVQLDVERLIRSLGYQEVLTPRSTERTNTMFTTPTALRSLEDMTARYKLAGTDDATGSGQQTLLPLLLAKTFFPTCFADALDNYVRRCGRLSEDRLQVLVRDDVEANYDEPWTAWQPPASLVVDISPSRGKNTRAHLPRALLLYMPEERGYVELKLSAWDITAFVVTDVDNAALREELTVLITTKHNFVLELLDASHAEAALSLVSQLINEHALLSVPEWYLLASFAVASAIENGKFCVMDRIAVFPPTDQRQLNLVVRDRGNDHTAEKTVKHQLVDECGASEYVASALTRAVLVNHQDHGNSGSVTRDLADIVHHYSSIEEVAADDAERHQMTVRLLRLLDDTSSSVRDGIEGPHDDSTKAAVLSSELLSDLLAIGGSSLALLAQKPDEEWLQRHSIDDGEDACERLCSSFSHVRSLFGSLQAASKLEGDSETPFFPWRSFDVELAAQLSAFEAVHTHLKALRLKPITAATTSVEPTWNRQQQLASLVRGFAPFEWVTSFFTGTAWPSRASGAVSVGQMLLLIACRVRVLVRCLRGDRAWALNLAVVGDACRFLHDIRSYAATELGVPTSALVLVLELDSASDVSDTTTASSKEDDKKTRALAVANHLTASRGVDQRPSDWHGAVLRLTDGGVESWGIRVEGLVLVQQAPSTTTTLYPLPMCRIMCQPRSEFQSAVEMPVVLLPSMSPYQPTPSIADTEMRSEGQRVLLGRSVHSVVDIEAKTGSSERMRCAIGVPIFPDDETNDDNN